MPPRESEERGRGREPEGNPVVTGQKPTVEFLRTIFGEGTIFLPCTKKACFVPGWQKKTILDMDPDHVRKVDIAPQTSVLCGYNSDGLVCIDFDDESALRRFFSVIGKAMRTTRVAGRPGRAKLFFRVPKEEAGKKTKLTIDGANVGDFLTNGSQATVAGFHHEAGVMYRFEDEAPPARSTVEELRARLVRAGIECGKLAAASKEACDAVCSSAEKRKKERAPRIVFENSEVNEGIAAKLEGRKRAEERLSKEPPAVRKLYEEHIAPRWLPTVGGRNKFIVEAVPALLRRLAPMRVIELVTLFFDLHAEIFKSSREAHAHEAGEQLRNCLDTYRLSLPGGERALYDKLKERERAVFRICRDLARCNGDQAPHFYLSAGQAALRLAEKDMTAWRELLELAEAGFITMITPGTRRRKGIRGEATVWKWNLSLEPHSELRPGAEAKGE